MSDPGLLFVLTKSVSDRYVTAGMVQSVNYRCHHVNQHCGTLSKHPFELAWRHFLISKGWLETYCYLYYPQHLRYFWIENFAPVYGDFI